MPTYVYRCKACGGEKEVFHSISEIDNPKDETLEETTCPYDQDCRVKWRDVLGSLEQPTEEDLRLKRVPQSPNVMGMYGGSSLKGVEKEQAIRVDRSERSRRDFERNIYPTLPASEQKHFKRKWEKQGRTDRIEKAEKIKKSNT